MSSSRSNTFSRQTSIRPAHSLSPNVSFSPRRSDADSPISERILSLMTTLSERVQHLESRLEGGSELKNVLRRKKPQTSMRILNQTPLFGCLSKLDLLLLKMYSLRHILRISRFLVQRMKLRTLLTQRLKMPQQY